MQESKLIYMILCLQKKTFTFHNVIIVIKSVLKKNEKHCYCNIFLVLIIYLNITKINKFLYKL